jgi:hypothetical protein
VRRQNHVVRLDALELFEQRARRLTQPGALLPQLERLPQHKGEEAHEDVGLHAVLALVPDRARRSRVSRSAPLSARGPQKVMLRIEGLPCSSPKM